MRINIFTNDHRVKPKRVRGSSLTFSNGNRSYTVDPQEIYITQNLDIPKKKGNPTSFYFENNPQPVGYFEPNKFKDRSGEYLERAIAINAVKQQSSQSIGKTLIPALEALGGYITIGNIFLLIVAVALAWSYITGEFL